MYTREREGHADGGANPIQHFVLCCFANLCTACVLRVVILQGWSELIFTFTQRTGRCSITRMLEIGSCALALSRMR